MVSSGCWLVASGEPGTAWPESRQLAPRWSMVEMYSVSREIQAAAGSFDYVRLAPHSAQDDRHVGCEGVQGVRRSINFRWRESRQLALRRSVVEVYICLVRSKQQRGPSTTFGWHLTPLKMTDMWVVSACRVRRSINFRPSNSPPKRSLDGAPVYGHLTGARDGGPCDRRPGA
jgi:hypothetical protein